MKPVREFGRLYDYLKDHALRATETGDLRLVVRDADFAGETFIGGKWQNFRFVNCLFSASLQTDLRETSGCTFETCEFGARVEPLYFGTMQASLFQYCRFTDAALGIGPGTVSFYGCEFDNATRKCTHILGDGTLPLLGCLKSDWRKYLPDRHIVLRHCTIPYLAGNYFLAANLVIEGCTIGTLDLRNSRIRNFAVLNTQLGKIDLSSARVNMA